MARHRNHNHRTFFVLPVPAFSSGWQYVIVWLLLIQQVLGSGILIADLLDSAETALNSIVDSTSESQLPERDQGRSRELQVNDIEAKNPTSSSTAGDFDFEANNVKVNQPQKYYIEYGESCRGNRGSCDTSRGFLCTISKNPKFLQKALVPIEELDLDRNRNGDFGFDFPTGSGLGLGPVCDCPPTFFYDPESKECRRRLGDVCVPSDLESDSEEFDIRNNWNYVSTLLNRKQGRSRNSAAKGKLWNGKCPENAECSRDVGKYGPKGARGICRCQPGFIISSSWFVDGGGATCEPEIQDGKSVQNQLNNNVVNNDRDYHNYEAPKE